MIDKKVFQFLLTFLGSFAGQLIVRITTLDGSLDKWWLLLPPLSVPPLSIIPAYLIYKNKLKKGHGGHPYDVYVMIPAIGSIICGMMIEKSYKDSGTRGTLFKFFINFLSISIALYLRDVDSCIIDIPRPGCTPQISSQPNITTPPPPPPPPPKKTNSSVVILPRISLPKINLPKVETPKFVKDAGASIKSGFNKISGKFRVNEDFTELDSFVKKFNRINSKPKNIKYNKIIVQSAIICAALPIMPYILIKVPLFEKFITRFGTISPYTAIFTDGFIRLLTVVIVYILINMYNGKKTDRSCKKTYKRNTAIFILILSVLFNLFLSNKADLIPYNKAELNPS